MSNERLANVGSPPSAVGNAAAMREALEKIVAMPVLDEECQCPECVRQRTVRDIARAALAAPLRNCDRFRMAEEAHRMWRKYLGCHAILAQGWRTIDVLDWLFAIAKEGGAE